MSEYCPMTALPVKAGYKAGDVLVLVGELFGRGYANGLQEEAVRLGMEVIGTTVGRRNSDGSLRPLTAEELVEAENLLGGSIINIPLEAGFDMETPDGAPSVSERLKKAKPDDWDSISFETSFVEQACMAGKNRFISNLKLVVEELEKRIPATANIVIAHTMAGGIPRARFFMPLLNRVFKGTGDKYLASEPFWKSSIGQLCDKSFNEVTADTFSYLLEATAPLRQRAENAGASVAYTAYGYHGTSVMINEQFRWQSYTPYLQGFAKMRLEGHALSARQHGINATVFNCPEILTNSSALFLGVELSLYPLATAIRQAAPKKSSPLLGRCAELLADGYSLEHLTSAANDYLATPLINNPLSFEGWPQHSTQEQMELMLKTSSCLMEMHRDQKQLVCSELSRLVFRSTGRLMIQASWSSAEPSVWLNHDIISGLVGDCSGADLLE